MRRCFKKLGVVEWKRPLALPSFELQPTTINGQHIGDIPIGS